MLFYSRSSPVCIDYCWQAALPVELSSFTAASAEKKIILNWETKTEINLNKFVIERSSDNKNFQVSGEVLGHGNSMISSKYSFTDNKVEPGIYYYRLKMTDMNGAFKYSNLEEVKLNAPGVWSLSQNYPNPFNPATLIAYSVSYESRVGLKVFNSLGEKVGEFNEGLRKPGYYQINFDGAGFPSGVYYYMMNVISTNGMELSSSIKKRVLIK
jgi:hypothetical protein